MDSLQDPFLGYTLVQPIVAAIQAQGVIANVKHYIDNNQEGLINKTDGALGGPTGLGDRHGTSAEIDERTQMELYWPVT